VASTGVLQGEAASAKVSPAKYACTPRMSYFDLIQNIEEHAESTGHLDNE